MSKLNLDTCLDFLQGGGFTLVTSAPTASGDSDQLKELSSRGQIALVIGSEGEGVSQRLAERSELRLAIRHSDRVESLNAGVAGSLLMRELYDLSDDPR